MGRSMVSHPLIDDQPAAQDALRIYSVCSFDRGIVVPRVQLLEAVTDEEAVSAARSMDRFKSRELWHRHRLIAVFAPESCS